ncbi:chorismate-binding protein [Myroides sp. LJL119]
MELFEKLEEHYTLQMPFAIYRKADSCQAFGIFQDDKQLYKVENFDEQGFVFAPFFKGERFYIPTQKSQIIKHDLSKINIEQTTYLQDVTDNDNQNNFEDLVKRCIKAIGEQSFSKVVASRKETLDIKVTNLILLFQNLSSSYPTAFCSIVYHPEIGLWCGATPETLLNLNKDILHTMALAGTQVNLGQKQVDWGDKEKQEQQFVTDFIIQGLSPFSQEITCSKPYTKSAAKVMHICTDIYAKLKQQDLRPIVEALHPTPAVCGMPKQPALDFLINQEGYNREYYAGYLGELNFCANNPQSQATDLYVNLRCMSIKQDSVDLYIGCGITKDSNPSLEFLETVNKSSTMKKILN